MISLELCNQILNEKGQRFTELQIKKVREFLYQMAQIEFLCFKIYKENEKGGYLFTCLD
jgi:hypothetical protein